MTEDEIHLGTRNSSLPASLGANEFDRSDRFEPIHEPVQTRNECCQPLFITEIAQREVGPFIQRVRWKSQPSYCNQAI